MDVSASRMAPPRRRRDDSRLDLHALPEGDAIADLVGLGLGIGVVPGRIGMQLAVDQQREIARRALPGAGGLVIAEGHMVAVERIHREVVVAFDEHGVVALGDRDAVPGCFHVPSRLFD